MVRRTLRKTCIVVLVSSLSSGCIFGVSTDVDSSASDASDGDVSGADASDTGRDLSESDGSDTDTGIVCGPDAGAECDCNFGNDSDGVCGEARLNEKGTCQKPEAFESDETTCDELDNDCDGHTDEGCPCAFDGTTEGVCGNARLDEEGDECVPPDSYEMTESTCDAKDNDCDGNVDGEDANLDCSCDPEDSEPQSCYTGPEGTDEEGICEKGEQSCTDQSEWGSCIGEQTPKKEGDGTNCNGKDDDCDGVVDEGCPCAYDDEDRGVCADQSRTAEGDCPKPSSYEEGEDTCDDGLDNDCDGDIDCNDSDCTTLLFCS